MRSSDLSSTTWHTSSRSNDAGNANCVEVARLSDRIALRDSKDPDGPVLAFSRAGWRAFLSSARTGQFD